MCNLKQKKTKLRHAFLESWKTLHQNGWWLCPTGSRVLYNLRTCLGFDFYIASRYLADITQLCFRILQGQMPPSFLLKNYLLKSHILTKQLDWYNSLQILANWEEFSWQGIFVSGLYCTCIWYWSYAYVTWTNSKVLLLIVAVITNCYRSGHLSSGSYSWRAKTRFIGSHVELLLFGKTKISFKMPWLNFQISSRTANWSLKVLMERLS